MVERAVPFLLQKFVSFHFCFREPSVLGGHVVTIPASVHWAVAVCRHCDYLLNPHSNSVEWVLPSPSHRWGSRVGDARWFSVSLAEPGFWLQCTFLIPTPASLCPGLGFGLPWVFTHVFVCSLNSCFKPLSEFWNTGKPRDVTIAHCQLGKIDMKTSLCNCGVISTIIKVCIKSC